ncbi:MAG: hypothetical protein U0414_06815 [Polyangiaceae bacterium]
MIPRRPWVAVALAGLVACSSEEGTTSSSVSSTVSSSATGGSSTSSGAGGAHDPGMPSDVYPAFHPTLPTLVKESGAVLTAPRIVPVYFAGDDAALTQGMTNFTAALGASSYWAAVATEYGVGAATATAPVELAETADAHLDDADVQAWLAAKLDADDPAFPAPDANTIYLLVYPKGTTVTIEGATTCVDLGAYHNSTKLDAAHGGLDVPYAVIPRCGAFQGLSGIDELTVAASHEILEAATDPLPFEAPAFDTLDPDHAVWPIFTGNEVCDLCDASRSSYGKLPGFDFAVERCWSNAAASALHDPCVPANPATPYFNSAPVLPDTIHFSGLSFPGLIVPVGETRELEIDLFSEAKTSGPWTVTATDLVPSFGGAPELDLALDRSTGVNGEKLWLSVTAKKKASSGFSIAVLLSKLGEQTGVWIIPIGNK